MSRMSQIYQSKPVFHYFLNKMPEKFLMPPPLFVQGGKYQGASGQWRDHLASAGVAQKVANI